MTREFDALWDRCGELAREANILARLCADLERAGLVGEERAAKLLYLVLTSRIFARPVSAVLRGPSSTGKSCTLQKVVEFVPPESYLDISAMSQRALIYLDQSLVHRFLVAYEATGVQGQVLDYLLRSLLSEGRLRYFTCVRTRAGVKTIEIDRPGPTGFITTTCGALHPENETRLLSIPVDESVEQTARVLRKQAESRRESVNYPSWHALQGWISLGEPEICVPYAGHLAAAVAETNPPVRMRRDFLALLTLISAHALVHRATRQRNDDGFIEASLDDYARVRELVAHIIGIPPDAGLDPLLFETVEAVQQLTPRGSPVTNDAVATLLRIDKSSASRRVSAAIEAGQLENRSRRGRAADLVVTAAAAKHGVLLPTADELAERLRDRPSCAVAGATLSSAASAVGAGFSFEESQ